MTNKWYKELAYTFSHDILVQQSLKMVKGGQRFE